MHVKAKQNQQYNKQTTSVSGEIEALKSQTKHHMWMFIRNIFIYWSVNLVNLCVNLKKKRKEKIYLSVLIKIGHQGAEEQKYLVHTILHIVKTLL